MISASARRSLLRWTHLVFSVPIIGYVYSPFEAIPDYAPLTRFFFLPVLVASGLWLWKGQAVRRMFARRNVTEIAGDA